MPETTLWHRASRLEIQTTPGITGGFDIGFDEKIPEFVKAELRAFVRWVEQNFRLPVTLWVDFEFRHYLLDRNRKRVGYLFYWTEFSTYPVFGVGDEIPLLRLPVRTERSSMEDILASFIEGISCYYAWLSNSISQDFICDDQDTQAILEAYLSCRTDNQITASRRDTI